MAEETKSSYSNMQEAVEDARPGEISQNQYDAVFGEITEDGPNYRGVGAPPTSPML